MTCCDKYTKLLKWDCCGCSYPWLDKPNEDGFVYCPYCSTKLTVSD